MNKTLIVACAVAGGLFAALAAPPPAQALPSVNLGIEKKADAVTPVGRRGHRGGGRHAGRSHSYGGRHAHRGRGVHRGHVRRHRFHHGRVHRRRFHGRRFRRFRRFYPYVAYGYYGGGCAWLRRRAYYTGSAYWWSRYNRCRYYY